MHGAVYLHLLRTYGRRPGLWFSVACELIRTLVLRVLIIIIMAQIAVAIASGDLESAKRYVIYFLISHAAASIIGVIGDLVAIWTENHVYAKLSAAYYKKLISKDMSFYRDHQAGYLVSLFRQYLDGAMLMVRFLRGDAVRVLVSLTVPPVVLWATDWRLGAIALALVVAQFIYIVWSSAKANVYRMQSHEVYRQVTGEVSDNITNITTFKSSGEQQHAYKTFKALTQQETQSFWLRRRTAALFDLPRDLIIGGGITLALWAVLSMATTGPQVIGVVVLTFSYMFQIVRNVSEVSNLISQHDDLVTKLHPTLEFLGNAHETIRDPKKPKRLRKVAGAIAVQNIDFSYADSSDKIFKNLDIHIASGEHVGIVGLSGAGKSTLVSLLMRFDDVTGGKITVDGTDIRDLRQSDLHRNIAYVPQEPLLFHRTIRENIAYLNERASDADVIAAAKAAHAHEFIIKLPKGYDTLVGERGVKLSGGQKQRVVIARAVLKDAPIIIFDEATSALDSESERIIQEALPKIMGKHTAVVIAHRLSTLANLDRILVMHHGEIIESGTHAELLALGGRYATLWQKQTGTSA